MRFNISVAWTKIQAIADQFMEMLPNLILALVVFALFYVAAKWIRTLVKRFSTRFHRANHLGRLLGRLAQVFVLLLGLLVSLSIVIPTFKASDLIQLLGIGSVAVGFAFRDIFQNFLAGILLLITEPFQIGDQIVVNSYEGTVEDIHTRATTIRTYDGRRVVIPNSTLFTQSVIVNTAFPHRRSEYDVGIGYGDDIGRARELILEAIRSVDGVLADPAPEAIVMALASSSVNIRARWWTKSPRGIVLAVQSEVITAIKTRLAESGIDLPFPTQHILFHDQTEETDGDRTRQREGWPAGSSAAPQPRSIATLLSKLLEQRVPSENGPTPNGRRG